MSQDSNPNRDKHASFQDVIPPKRSIRDIPIPENRRKAKPAEVEYPRPTQTERVERPAPVYQKREEIEEVEAPEVEEEVEEETVDEVEETEEEVVEQKPAYVPKKSSSSRYANIPDGHFSNMGKRKSPKKLLLLGGVLVLGAVVFALFSSAGGAQLKITPRQEATSVEATMSAKKNPLETELGYEVITLSKELSEAATATGETEVSRKASGSVIIYNDYSKDNQTLIANTRLETPDGLIYRIPEQIIVPGQQTVDGKTTPGSVEVKVFADQPGEKYNITAANFTIPGFKDDPRYEKFTAKTKGSMSGGFVGVEKQVSESDLSQIKSKLQTTLKDELVKEIRAQLPPSFIMYENGTTMSYETLPTKTVEGNNVQVIEKGTISAVAFDREEFARFIAQIKGANQGATFAGIENLSFELLNTPEITPATAEISFTVRGNGQLVWGYDEAKLKQDLVGKNKKELTTILSGYPNIEKAEAILKPFWTRSFPDTVDKISISNIIGE